MELTFRDVFHPLYIPVNFHRAATGKIAANLPPLVNLSVERLRKTCNTKSISFERERQWTQTLYAEKMERQIGRERHEIEMFW